ncbi:hypothetical protein RZY48_000443 [Vibrio navarrensis]|uniref:Uncharacterized protein n=1 Tax=Vibrio navarrensis TaxID=29495 RepID=A0AAI9G702_9VIBR|nr:hypothetical protein [Vibrio navarrensis]EJL6401249.1 hypothetical protein [Vibrio navarrensis]EJL6568046.1 hypothetical protein [Vibrio navarrensis]ELN6931073.1 hypothetical protein [Vibrio navarrensis]
MYNLSVDEISMVDGGGDGSSIEDYAYNKLMLQGFNYIFGNNNGSNNGSNHNGGAYHGHAGGMDGSSTGFGR